jgi:YHS domain-containing protein
MFRTFIAAAFLATGGLIAPAACAAKPEIYTSIVSDLAVGGYDAVAYFKDGKPVEGSKSFEMKHKGATWRFANAANLAAFKADPAKYAPQYGGHCAWAAANGYTAKGDPKYWKVVGDKLYLNYNADIQGKWEKDVPGFIAKGDANWPGILAK